MIHVIRLDFDHDDRDKAARFGRFCEAIADTGCFDAEPLIVDTPCFSYGRKTGVARIETVLNHVGNREGIVFLDKALGHYHDGSLTEYLLARSVPFGTLNDNHQDDYFAVSFCGSFWNCDPESLAFIA